MNSDKNMSVKNTDSVDKAAGVQTSNRVQHVFLVGAKSLGAYGGYETFINKLTEYHQNNQSIKYHVACKANGPGYMDERTLAGVSERVIKDGQVVEFTYHNAYCFKIHVPEKLGSEQAIYYDVASLKKSIEIIKKQNIQHTIVYIMACRIGPFIHHYYKAIHRLGGCVYLNPDGDCEIIWSTRENPDFMWVCAA